MGENLEAKACQTETDEIPAGALVFEIGNSPDAEFPQGMIFSEAFKNAMRGDVKNPAGEVQVLADWLKREKNIDVSVVHTGDRFVMANDALELTKASEDKIIIPLGPRFRAFTQLQVERANCKKEDIQEREVLQGELNADKEPAISEEALRHAGIHLVISGVPREERLNRFAELTIPTQILVFSLAEDLKILGLQAADHAIPMEIKYSNKASRMYRPPDGTVIEISSAHRTHVNGRKDTGTHSRGEAFDVRTKNIPNETLRAEARFGEILEAEMGEFLNLVVEDKRLPSYRRTAKQDGKHLHFSTNVPSNQLADFQARLVSAREIARSTLAEEMLANEFGTNLQQIAMKKSKIEVASAN